jgi:hypothetical protein
MGTGGEVVADISIALRHAVELKPHYVPRIAPLRLVSSDAGSWEVVPESWWKNSPGSRCSTIHKLCSTALKVSVKGCAYAEKDQRKQLGPGCVSSK